MSPTLLTMCIPFWPQRTQPLATSRLDKAIVPNWFHEHDNEFNVLQGPSQSPDLNPIRTHLWDVVARKIRSMNVL